MIDHLGLNSYYLVRNRETAIEESGFYDEEAYTEDEILDVINYFNKKYIVTDDETDFDIFIGSTNKKVKRPENFGSNRIKDDFRLLLSP